MKTDINKIELPRILIDADNRSKMEAPAKHYRTGQKKEESRLHPVFKQICSIFTLGR